MAIILPVVALSVIVFILELLKGKRSPNRNPELKVTFIFIFLCYIGLSLRHNNICMLINSKGLGPQVV